MIRKFYVNITFDMDSNFDQPAYLVDYDGFQIEIEDGESNAHNLYIPAVHYKEATEEYKAALRFLSEVVWIWETRVEILAYGCGTGKSKTRFLDRSFNRFLHPLKLDNYKQFATTEKQKLALGIYRDAVCSNSIFYKCICYIRIINISFNKNDQIDWINNNIGKIKYNGDILDKLRKDGIKDIGNHLYVSGRCATAHAYGKPIADPNNWDDISRIWSELPLFEELAEIFIIDELGVEGFNRRV